MTLDKLYARRDETARILANYQDDIRLTDELIISALRDNRPTVVFTTEKLAFMHMASHFRLELARVDAEIYRAENPPVSRFRFPWKK